MSRQSTLRSPGAHFLIVVVLLCLPGGCGLREAIDIQVLEKIETDHWLGDGTKQCQPKVKILNNTGYDLLGLGLSLYWMDGHGDERETVLHMNERLESNKATPAVPLIKLFGQCDQISLVRFGNVVTCQLNDQSEQDCIARLNLVDFRQDI